jgi:hypothetical protein
VLRATRTADANADGLADVEMEVTWQSGSVTKAMQRDCVDGASTGDASKLLSKEKRATLVYLGNPDGSFSPDLKSKPALRALGVAMP